MNKQINIIVTGLKANAKDAFDARLTEMGNTGGGLVEVFTLNTNDCPSLLVDRRLTVLALGADTTKSDAIAVVAPESSMHVMVQ